MAVLLSIAAILVEISEDIEFYSSLAFLTIFVTEMLLKFFAMGVFGAHGYFADSFCKLDFLLVLLQIFDVCCSVLPCVAVCRSVSQCGAIRRNLTQCIVWCSGLQWVVVCCSLSRCVVVWCNKVQCDAMYRVL